MDIVLTNPYPEGAFGINETTIEVPFDTLYIASFLQAHGFKCGYHLWQYVRSKKKESREKSIILEEAIE